MNPYRNTFSRSMTYKESLAIVPNNSPISPSPSKSVLGNIHNYIKSLTYMTDKYHSDMKTINYNISDMLQNLTAINSKTYKHEEKIKEILYKLSNYEDRLKKLSIKDTQIQPFSLHIKKRIDTSYKTDKNEEKSHKLHPKSQLMKTALTN